MASLVESTTTVELIGKIRASLSRSLAIARSTIVSARCRAALSMSSRQRGGNDSTSSGNVSATEMIRTTLSVGQGRFATSSTATSLHPEPSTAIKIFIALPPSRFRRRGPIDHQTDQVVATDYAQHPPVEHYRNLGDILLIHQPQRIFKLCVGRDRIDLIRPPHRRLHRRLPPFIARDGEHVVERDNPARSFALAHHITPPSAAEQEMLDELREAGIAS